MAPPPKKEKEKKRKNIHFGSISITLQRCQNCCLSMTRRRFTAQNSWSAPPRYYLIGRLKKSKWMSAEQMHPSPPLIQTAVAHFIKREERAEAALVDLKTKFDLDTLSLFSSLYISIPNSTRITSITTPTHPPTYSTTVPHPSEMALFTVHYQVWIQGSSAWALGWSWQPGRNWGRLGKKASICNSPPNKIISSPGDWQPSKDPPNSQAGPQKGARSHIVFTL